MTTFGIESLLHRAAPESQLEHIRHDRYVGGRRSSLGNDFLVKDMVFFKHLVDIRAADYERQFTVGTS